MKKYIVLSMLFCIGIAQSMETPAQQAARQDQAMIIIFATGRPGDQGSNPVNPKFLLGQYQTSKRLTAFKGFWGTARNEALNQARKFLNLEASSVFPAPTKDFILSHGPVVIIFCEFDYMNANRLIAYNTTPLKNLKWISFNNVMGDATVSRDVKDVINANREQFIKYMKAADAYNPEMIFSSQQTAQHLPAAQVSPAPHGAYDAAIAKTLKEGPWPTVAPAAYKAFNLAPNNQDHRSMGSETWASASNDAISGNPALATQGANILFYEKTNPFHELPNTELGYPLYVDDAKTPHFNIYADNTQTEKGSWASSEQYFQAHKFAFGSSDYNAIRATTGGRDSQLAARGKTLQSTWFQESLDVMLRALWAKFTQHDALKAMLIATNPKILVENSGKDDHTWGNGANGKGLNHLGQMLMFIRARLLKQIPENESYMWRTPSELNHWIASHSTAGGIPIIPVASTSSHETPVHTAPAKDAAENTYAIVYQSTGAETAHVLLNAPNYRLTIPDQSSIDKIKNTLGDLHLVRTIKEGGKTYNLYTASDFRDLVTDERYDRQDWYTVKRLRIATLHKDGTVNCPQEERVFKNQLGCLITDDDLAIIKKLIYEEAIKPATAAELQNAQQNLVLLAESLQALSAKVGHHSDSEPAQIRSESSHSDTIAAILSSPEIGALLNSISEKDASSVDAHTHNYFTGITFTHIKAPNVKVTLKIGDIVNSGADAIVNAANEGCLGGSGIDGAIVAAGGSGLAVARQALPAGKNGARCPTGNARVTISGDLRAARGTKYVIHATAPVCDTENTHLLKQAYQAAIDTAVAVNVGVKNNKKPILFAAQSYSVPNDGLINSLAIPSLGTGIFGCKVADGAPAVVDAITHYFSSLKAYGPHSIILVFWQPNKSDSDLITVLEPVFKIYEETLIKAGFAKS